MNENPSEVSQKKESILNWPVSGIGFILIIVFVKFINPFIQLFAVNPLNKYYGLTGFVLDAGVTLLITLAVGFVLKKHGFINGLFLGIVTLIVAVILVLPSSQIGWSLILSLSLALTLPAIIGCVVGTAVSKINKANIIIILLITLAFVSITGTVYYFSTQGMSDLLGRKATTSSQVTGEEKDKILVLKKDERVDKLWQVFVSEKHGFQITLDEERLKPQETDDGLETTEIIALTGEPASVQTGLSIKISDDSASKIITDLKAEYSVLEEETALDINGLLGNKLTFHLDEYPYEANFYIIEDKNRTFIIESHHVYDEKSIGSFLLLEEQPKVKSDE